MFFLITFNLKKKLETKGIIKDEPCGSEKLSDNDWGQKQQEDTGTSWYGTVTQVAFTALHGTHTGQAGLAALGDYVVALWDHSERETSIEDDRTRFGVCAGFRVCGSACVAS